MQPAPEIEPEPEFEPEPEVEPEPQMQPASEIEPEPEFEPEPEVEPEPEAQPAAACAPSGSTEFHADREVHREVDSAPGHDAAQEHAPQPENAVTATDRDRFNLLFNSGNKAPAQAMAATIDPDATTPRQPDPLKPVDVAPSPTDVLNTGEKSTQPEIKSILKRLAQGTPAQEHDRKKSGKWN